MSRLRVKGKYIFKVSFLSNPKLLCIEIRIQMLGKNKERTHFQYPNINCSLFEYQIFQYSNIKFSIFEYHIINIPISNYSNAVDYDNLRRRHQLLPLPEHLHAEFAGQHGDDVADESGDDLYQGRQVLDHDIAGDLTAAIGDVDVELERVEEDVRERDDDTEAPETRDHCRGITIMNVLKTMMNVGTQQEKVGQK